MSEENGNQQHINEQATRVVKQVTAQTAAAPQETPAQTAPETVGAAEPVRRRRRSDQYENNASPVEEKTEQAENGRSETIARPIVVSRKIDVNASAGKTVHEVPREGVPKPAALQRQGGIRREDEVRRPVSAPGYTTRKPLGYAVPPLSDDSRTPSPKQKNNRILTIVLIAVIAVGLVALGFLLFGGSKGSANGGTQSEAAEVLSFEASPLQASAPVEVAFSLSSNLSVGDVRLLNDSGDEIDCTSTVQENASGKVWVLKASYSRAYSGNVVVQMYDGADWVSSGKSVYLQITSNPLETAAPTEEPTEVPTDIPETEAPTEEAAAVIVTETPTMLPTEEPSPTPTGIPLAPLVDGTQDEAGDDVDGTFVEEEVVDVDDPEQAAEAEVTAEPTAAPTEAPSATEKPARESLDIPVSESASLITTSTVYNGSKAISSYQRDLADQLAMPYVGEYTPKAYGILTFRGDSFRQNAAQGAVEDISSMNILWQYDLTGTIKSSGGNTVYTGVGYNSQPAIIQWSKEVREMSNMYDTVKETKALKEVIVACENGQICFLNLETGEATRDAIDVGYPMHASPSIHPYGFPLMVVGQYAKKISGVKKASIGLRIYNLLDGKQLSLIDGLDGNSKRPSYTVGSFETSSLIDAASDTMISVGTNGLLYATKLKTDFNINDQTITVDPSSVVMKSSTKEESSSKKSAYNAIESSPVSYQGYVWYADMDGILRCVDVNTMTILWAVDTGDAVQASLALDEDENGDLWLYTANTMTNRTKGTCDIRRYNAVTGEESWTLSVGMNTKNKKIKYTKGVMASPVIGQNDLSGLVFFTVSGISADGASGLELGSDAVDGAVIAVSKESGKVAWAKALDTYSYSSPVAVYNEEGKGWLIQASNSGMMTLYDAEAGDVLNTLQLDGNINGSPAVYKSTLVIGTQGSKTTSHIYGIRLE